MDKQKIARELMRIAGKITPGIPDGTGPAGGGPPMSGRRRGPCVDPEDIEDEDVEGVTVRRRGRVAADTGMFGGRTVVARRVTERQLIKMTNDLKWNEWEKFAERVSKIDPVLGAWEQLHAEAADGNSPPVQEWPEHVMDDMEELEDKKIDTPEAAEAHWMLLYG